MPFSKSCQLLFWIRWPPRQRVTLAHFLTPAASNCWANPITPGSKITATAFFLLFLNPREMPLTLCNPSLEIPALTVTRLDLPQSNDDWPEIQSWPRSRRGVTEWELYMFCERWGVFTSHKPLVSCAVGSWVLMATVSVEGFRFKYIFNSVLIHCSSPKGFLLVPIVSLLSQAE